jgi:hypothetical protein
MMQLIFPSNKSIEIAFKVGIAGTSSQPQSVAVVLERDSMALSFHAAKLGDEWTATVNNPGAIFAPGQVKLSVNVLLNNRLFTPLKTSAEIVDGENVTVDITPAISIPLASPVVDAIPVPQNTVAPSVVKAAPLIQQEPGPSPDLPIVQPETTAINVQRDAEELAIKRKELAKKTEAAPPTKLSLLKTIEPGFVKKPVQAPNRQMSITTESVKPAQDGLFKLKKVKIVFK